MATLGSLEPEYTKHFAMAAAGLVGWYAKKVDLANTSQLYAALMELSTSGDVPPGELAGAATDMSAVAGQAKDFKWLERSLADIRRLGDTCRDSDEVRIGHLQCGMNAVSAYVLADDRTSMRRVLEELVNVAARVEQIAVLKKAGTQALLLMNQRRRAGDPDTARRACDLISSLGPGHLQDSTLSQLEFAAKMLLVVVESTGDVEFFGGDDKPQITF